MSRPRASDAQRAAVNAGETQGWSRSSGYGTIRNDTILTTASRLRANTPAACIAADVSRSDVHTTLTTSRAAEQGSGLLWTGRRRSCATLIRAYLHQRYATPHKEGIKE